MDALDIALGMAQRITAQLAALGETWAEEPREVLRADCLSPGDHVCACGWLMVSPASMGFDGPGIEGQCILFECPRCRARKVLALVGRAPA